MLYVPDEGLPQEPYTPDIFSAKVQLVFDHVLTAYGDNGDSPYDSRVDIQQPAGRLEGSNRVLLIIDSRD